MEDVVRTYVPAESVEEQWDLKSLEKVLAEEWKVDIFLTALVEKSDSVTDEDIVEHVQKAADELFDSKVARVGIEQFTPFMRMILLQSIDQHWREHLAALDYLRQGIHLRGYAQKNPKQEYKREAFELFSQMLDIVKMDVTRILMSVRVQSEEEVREAALAIEERAEHIGNVTYTHPNDDGSVSEERGSETAAAQAAMGAVAAAMASSRAAARCRRWAGTILVLAGAGRSTSNATAGWPSATLASCRIPMKRRPRAPFPQSHRLLSIRCQRARLRFRGLELDGEEKPGLRQSLQRVQVPAAESQRRSRQELPDGARHQDLALAGDA